MTLSTSQVEPITMAVGDAFNVNDELNITGTTMTIDADEDAAKVIMMKILRSEPCNLQITKRPHFSWRRWNPCFW